MTRMLPLLLCTISMAADSDAVVRIGGCSGVCVDASGIVLTAKHCDLGESALVTFPNHPPVLAHRIHVGPDAEDVVVFDCPGEAWPCLLVANTVPSAGTSVRSLGYPNRNGARSLRSAEGRMLGGGTFTFQRDGVPVGKFLANETSIVTGPGWSGGPLLDENGEVVGILSAGSPTQSTFISHAATRRAYEFALGQLEQDAQKPHVLLFGFTGCRHCRRAWDDVGRGRFGRVMKVERDRVETDRYVFEYVHVDTKPGAARYTRLVDALEKATDKRQSRDTFPAWHVAGRAAITTGYPERTGWRRLGGWFVETLRLPVTVFEGVSTSIDSGTSSFPVAPEVALGEADELPPFEAVPEEPDTGLGGLASDRIEDLVRDRIDERLGDETLLGRLADRAVDRVSDRIDERLEREPPERDEIPLPWGGGLTGIALAAAELWARRRLAA